MNKSTGTLHKNFSFILLIALIISILLHLSFLLSASKIFLVNPSNPRPGSILKGFWDPFFHDTDRAEWGLDFFSIYQAGYNFKKDLSVYFGVRNYPFDNQYLVVPYYSGFRYLPFYAYSFGYLLTFLPPWTSYLTWIIFVEFLFLFNIYILFKYAPGALENKILSSIIWFSYTPFYIELHIGQQSMVTVTFLHLVGIFHYYKKYKLRDLAYIASAVWKLNTLLLLPVWIKMKRFKTIILLFFLIFLVSFPYFYMTRGSFPEFISYFKHKFIANGPNSLGLWALLSSSMSRLGFNQYQERILLQLMNCMFWCSGLFLILLRKKIQFIFYFSLWIIMYFMTYQYVWEHHYILLLPVFSLLICYTGEKKWFIWSLFCLLPTPYIIFNDPSIPFPQETWNFLKDFLVHGMKVIPLFTMYIYLYYRIIKDKIGDRSSTEQLYFDYTLLTKLFKS